MDYEPKYDILALSKELEINIDDMFEIFNAYFIEVNDIILSLRYSRLKNDWIGFQKSLHNIKGISINLKILNIYETATILDKLIKARDFHAVDSYINRLENLSAKVRLDINASFET